MTPERYKQVAGVFAIVRQAPLDRRQQVLQQQCGDDAELLREVQTLLEHADAPRVSLEEPALAQFGSSLDVGSAPGSSSTQLPQVPGFEIKSELGAGGMGAVYLARQHQPERDVALKLVRPGYTDPQRLQRFAHEAELLARLEHPGIARLYAVDLLPTQPPQPYIAMEHVPGRTLQTYLTEEDPSLTRRLELFRTLTETVQYAHARGVLHRDLKPGNILVDASGQTRILDFGVGKLLGDEQTRQTLTGQVLGTPAYMSPEQARGETVDTRSDIYALGVILFEMLSGERPHDLRDQPLPVALRTVADTPARRLRQVAPQLPSDLERIVTCAMHPDPEQRYDSAAALGRDVQRYLQHEPLEARPPTLAYQLRCLARRHRWLVAAVGVAGLGLLVGGAGLTWGLLDAIQARGLAEKRQQQAEDAEQLAAERLVTSENALRETERQERIASAVNAFFNEDILRQLDPSQGRHDITLQEAIDAARTRLADRFADEPLVRASILYTLGDSYVTLARFDDAEGLLREALELRRAELPPLDDDVMRVESALVLVYSNRGEIERAIQLNEEMLAAREAKFGRDNPESLAMVNNLAMLHMDQGNLPQAITLSEEVCEAMQRLAPDNAETVASLINLALLYKRVDRLDDAADTLKTCDEIAQRGLPDEHPYYSYIWNHLGTLELLRGNYHAAAAEFQRTLTLREKLFGPDHPNTLNARTNLGVAYRELGRLDDAEGLLLETVERRSAGSDPRSASLLNDLHQLALLYRAMGDSESALRENEAVLAIRREDLGEDHPDTLLSAWLQGALLLDQRAADASDLLADTHRRQVSKLGDAHSETRQTLLDLIRADTLTDQHARAMDRGLALLEHPNPGSARLRARVLLLLAEAGCAIGDVRAQQWHTSGQELCAQLDPPPRACGQQPCASE